MHGLSLCMTINKPADLMVEGGPRHDMECERSAMCTVLKMRHVHEAITAERRCTSGLALR